MRRNYNDLFDSNRNGQQGFSTVRDPRAGSSQGSLSGSNEIQVFEHDIDSKWAEGWGGVDGTSAPNSYFDYYFSGQDVKVYVDGTEDDPEFASLPIVNFGYSISQQKMPVYGFWSYTSDSVMRGNRIVAGLFQIATKYPDYMRRLLTKAANTRATKQASYSYYRGLTEDDENIERYWGKNLDPAIAAAGNNVYSVHPPFSFVVVLGVQSYSVSPDALGSREEVYNQYFGDNPLHANENERLVESDPVDQSNRIILDSCEIQGMEQQFSPDGQVVTETYQFFARDIVLPLKTSTINSRAVPVLPDMRNPRHPDTDRLR